MIGDRRRDRLRRELKGVGAFFVKAVHFRDFIGMQAVLLSMSFAVTVKPQRPTSSGCVTRFAPAQSPRPFGRGVVYEVTQDRQASLDGCQR